MTIVLLPILIGIGIAMYGNDASISAWGAFVGIGGFVGLCFMASEGG